MADPKTPLDHAVELFVYAPIGLAVAARELMPQLVERGRRQFDPQVGMARAIGHLAAAQGRTQAEKVIEGALDRARVQAEATLRQLGILPDGPSTTPASVASDPVPASAAAPGPPVVQPAPPPGPPVVEPAPPPGPPVVEPAPPPGPPVVEPAPPPGPPVVEPAPPPTPPSQPDHRLSAIHLSIPDYDSLSASQVVPRLSSLTTSELAAVRAYEEAHRGRRTILHRIAQLQGA